jgi:hypothetical protein
MNGFVSSLAAFSLALSTVAAAPAPADHHDRAREGRPYLQRDAQTELRSQIVLISADQALDECAQLPSVIKTVRFKGVPSRFNDSVVKVLMTIDESGSPRDIDGLEPMPRALANSLIPALSQWQFTPACDKAGKPISLRIMLPIRLVGLR